LPRGTITALCGVKTVVKLRAVDRVDTVYSVPTSEARRLDDPSDFYKMEQSELSKAQTGVLYVELTETLGTNAQLRFSYEEAFKELVGFVALLTQLFLAFYTSFGVLARRRRSEATL
jgi:hypothetical protein